MSAWFMVNCGRKVVFFCYYILIFLLLWLRTAAMTRPEKVKQKGQKYNNLSQLLLLTMKAVNGP